MPRHDFLTRLDVSYQYQIFYHLRISCLSGSLIDIYTYIILYISPVGVHIIQIVRYGTRGYTVRYRSMLSILGLIHVLLSFAYSYHLFYVSCLIISHILFISSCTLLLILVLVYYHRIAVLCLSYYVIYSLHFICIYLSFSFMFHVCKYLRSGYGK